MCYANGIFYDWCAIVAILVAMAFWGGYISFVLIGFNREEAKKGFPPERF